MFVLFALKGYLVVLSRKLVQDWFFVPGECSVLLKLVPRAADNEIS